MPKGYPPSVFISSTCYDLSQIRLDLKHFVEGLGYEAVISNDASFPINPQADTIENCLNAVRSKADLFVLVIGTRYGSKHANGYSITNLEYLEAKARNIPIYVFVAKALVHNLPVWKANPTANFSNIVDDVRLFAFADQLRTQSGLWMYEFEDFQTISNALRQQWAVLFTEALLEREKLRSKELSADLMALPASALRVILEKPFGWEFRLLGATIKTCQNAQIDVQRDLKYGLRLKITHRHESPIETVNWLMLKFENARSLVQSAVDLFERAATDALGKVGEPGDPELIVYVGRKIADLTKRMLEWKMGFFEVAVGEKFDRLVHLVSCYCDDAIAKLEAFPSLINTELASAEACNREGKPVRMDLRMSVNVPPGLSEEISEQFRRIEANLS